MKQVEIFPVRNHQVLTAIMHEVKLTSQYCVEISKILCSFPAVTYYLDM